MKKILFALVLAFSLSLISCRFGKDESAESVNDTTAVDTTKVDTTAVKADTTEVKVDTTKA
jgi:hypothetical protein